MILAHRTVLTDHDLNIPGDVLSLIAYANKPAFQKAREDKNKTLTPKPATTPSASTPAKKDPAPRTTRKGKEVKSESLPLRSRQDFRLSLLV